MNLNVRFTGSILQDASVQLSVRLFFKPSHVFLDDARPPFLCALIRTDSSLPSTLSSILPIGDIPNNNHSPGRFA